MMEWALTSCSWIFRAIVLLRHFLYDNKILPQKYAPLPVVSIGNLVAGGAGKTQAALMLAQQLSQEFPLAILTRGYLGKAEHARDPLLVDVKKHSPALCGDEPWLLASRLKSTAVIVNKNRFRSAKIAEKLGVKLLILDDGMQHRQLHRDFEIVVIDATSPIDSFLPRGTLREDLGRLSKADLILFIGDPPSALKEKVSSLSAAPQTVAKVVSRGCFQLDGKPVEPVWGKKVGLFCGIGNPHRFVTTVEECGMKVVATQFSKDHRLTDAKKLAQFAVECKGKGASFLVCTEKDKVKLVPKSFPLPLLWLKAELSVVGNLEVWLRAIEAIKQLVPFSMAMNPLTGAP